MNRILLFIVISLVVFVDTSCKQKNQGQGYQAQPVELPVAGVSQGSVHVAKEYPASVEGVANVEVRAQVSGYLEKILVDEGDYVRAGQPLFIIESNVYREQLNNAQANLTSARIDLDRKKELVNTKIVSPLQVEQAQAVYQAAEAAVHSAQINLNFCTIKASVSGYLSRIQYRVGSLVAPTNATPLTTVSDIHQVNVYFSVSENDFLDFQQSNGKSDARSSFRNIPVELIISNGTKYPQQGKIDAVEGQFNAQTGSITLRAKFDNPQTILRSGNTGRVIMDHAYDNAVLVPVASTLMIQDKIFLFSIDTGGKAVQLPIEVSGKSGDQYIVSSGVKPGDQYIITGFERLQAGTPVVARKEEQTK